MIELDGLMGTSTPASAGSVIDGGASADFAAALSAMQIGDESPSTDERPAAPNADTVALVSGLAAVFLAAPVAPKAEGPVGPAVASLDTTSEVASGVEVDDAPVIDLAVAATPSTDPDSGPQGASSVTPAVSAGQLAVPRGDAPADELNAAEQLEVATGLTRSDVVDETVSGPSIDAVPVSSTTAAAGSTAVEPATDDAVVPPAPAAVTTPDPASGRVSSSNDSPIGLTPAGTEAVDPADAPDSVRPAVAAPVAEPSPFAGMDPETAAPVETVETTATPGDVDAPVAAETTLRPSDAVRAADVNPNVGPAGPAPRAVETPAPTAPAPSTMPDAPADATPAQQVAEALRDVRRLADGSHRLSLQLHPEELGAVQLEVAIREGQLHVRAVAETEAARVAIEQSLPELREELRDAGVRAGSLEVGPDTSGRDSAATDEPEAAPSGRSQETTPPDEQTDSPNQSTAGAVDIRL